MAEKAAGKPRGPFFQVGPVDPDLSRRFRALCEFRGEEPATVVSAFMADFIERHGPKTDAKPTPKKR